MIFIILEILVGNSLLWENAGAISIFQTIGREFVQIGLYDLTKYVKFLIKMCLTKLNRKIIR